jgi:hypothetical protein
MATMSRLSLAISLLALTACPQADILFPDPNESDAGSTSSTGAPEAPTTGEPDLSTSTGDDSSTTGNAPADCVELDLLTPADIKQVCEVDPWGRPECSTRNSPLPACEEVIAGLVDIAPCSDLTVCDYQLCAAAMEAAPCGTRPIECEPIVGCIVPEPPHVCSVGFCDDFEKVSIGSELDPEFAAELGKVCSWDPCIACSEVAKYCEAWPCEAGIAEKCAAEMATCDCA